MSKLSAEIPSRLDDGLSQFIPWGSKGVVVTELLWQLLERARRDDGKCIYDLIRESGERERRDGAALASDQAKGPR